MTRSLFCSVVITTLLYGSSPADAERPDVTLFAGATIAGAGAYRPSETEVCLTCATSRPASRDGSRVGLFAIGLAGSEGQVRGGGELFTLLGLPCSANGYSGAITYAGIDRGDLFAQAGLGLGTYWGGVTPGLATTAGNLHGQVGYRLTEEIVLMSRGDLILGSTAGNALLTIGIQLIPDARPAPRRAPRPLSPLREQPALGL